MDRKPYLKKIKRSVVKVGSGVLTRKNGLNLNLIDDITTEICWLRKRVSRSSWCHQAPLPQA